MTLMHILSHIAVRCVLDAPSLIWYSFAHPSCIAICTKDEPSAKSIKSTFCEFPRPNDCSLPSRPWLNAVCAVEHWSWNVCLMDFAKGSHGTMRNTKAKRALSKGSHPYVLAGGAGAQNCPANCTWAAQHHCDHGRKPFRTGRWGTHKGQVASRSAIVTVSICNFYLCPVIFEIAPTWIFWTLNSSYSRG